jgi:heme exporter protein D
MSKVQFESLSEFINMGGYAFYVWLSFGVTAGVMITLLIYSKFELISLKKEVKANVRRQQRIEQAKKQQITNPKVLK